MRASERENSNPINTDVLEAEAKRIQESDGLGAVTQMHCKSLVPQRIGIELGNRELPKLYLKSPIFILKKQIKAYLGIETK